MKELKKLYYSIGEVSDLTDLPPSVLRYWETEFGSLRPGKNRAGKRVYRKEDIDRVFLIKKLLYQDRFTIAGARKFLREERAEQRQLAKEAAAKALKVKVPADEIRRGLKEILDMLAK